MPRSRVAAYVATGWMLIAVLFATQAFIGSHYTMGPLSWTQSFSAAFVAWSVRGLASIPVFWLARRVSFTSGRVLRAVMVHAPVSIVVALLQQFIVATIVMRSGIFPGVIVSPVEVPMSVFVYWIVVGAAQAARLYARSHQIEMLAAGLRAQLASSRLELLRAHLQPHFLFNTMHDIAELMHEDAERADLMLTSLSALLRESLQEPAISDVTLARELSFLDQYLDIARMRFQERLHVAIDIEPSLRGARVPYLILQPLVENAIRHGVARRDGGRIEIEARRAGERLRVEVRDNGPGLEGRAPDEGLGLRTTRERLRTEFGDRHAFELVDRDGGGVMAALEIPLQMPAS